MPPISNSIDIGGIGIVTSLVPVFFFIKFSWYSWNSQDIRRIPMGFGISGIRRSPLVKSCKLSFGIRL